MTKALYEVCVCCLWLSENQALARMMRWHFVTLIEVGVNLIQCYPEHVSSSTMGLS